VSGIPQDALFGVTRISTTFADDAGINVKHGVGTAFWLTTKRGKLVLVTNRHNLDPSIRFPNNPELKTHSIEIALRSKLGDGPDRVLQPQTRFFKVDESKTRIFVLEKTDCGIVVPEYEESTVGFGDCTPFQESELADNEFFLTVLKTSDVTSFIGFAGKRKFFWDDERSEWWDQEWSLPIVRPAFTASYPGFEFHHKEIPFRDVVLVSGLSFSGSSGSPVISHQKSIWTSLPKPTIGSFEPKLIGIMSGHWWGENSDEVPPMFRDYRQHSGISYFTRSTSILCLIEQNEL